MSDQWRKQVEVYSARNAELAAEVERLREALDTIVRHPGMGALSMRQVASKALACTERTTGGTPDGA